MMCIPDVGEDRGLRSVHSRSLVPTIPSRPSGRRPLSIRRNAAPGASLSPTSSLSILALLTMSPKTKSQTSSPTSPSGLSLGAPSPSAAALAAPSPSRDRDRSPSVVDRKEALDLAYVVPYPSSPRR